MLIEIINKPAKTPIMITADLTSIIWVIALVALKHLLIVPEEPPPGPRHPESLLERE